MDDASGLDTQGLRAAVRRGRVLWQRHVLERMAERGIRRRDVTRVLLAGHCTRSYPEDKPFPSALFMARIAGRSIHVVAALDSAAGTAYIITAYEPTRGHFEADLKTRRRHS